MIKDLPRRQLFWPLVILAALLLFNLPFNGSFFDIGIRDGHLYGPLVSIVGDGTPYTLLALGMTLVIATGGIDLSVGAVLAISGAVACHVIAGAGDQNSLLLVFGAIGLALLAGAACGLFNGLMVARAGVQPIIATLILMVAGRGIAQLITGGVIETELSRPYAVIARYTLGVPTGVFIVAGFLILMTALTRRTALGLLVEAVGGNAEASRLAGVRAHRIKIMVYVFCALCAAVAGLWSSSAINGADANSAGLWFELDAILAVVIGGTPLTGGRFSIGGTLVGALILKTLKTTIFSIGISSQSNMVFEAAVVVIICLLQSPDFRSRAAGPFRRVRTPTPPRPGSGPTSQHPNNVPAPSVEVAP